MDLDIHIADEEATHFQYENRPIWPRVPTPCVVPVCGETPFYNFRTFMNHWNTVHIENKTLYKCSCEKKFGTRRNLRAHLKTMKDHHEVNSEIVSNREFIDPFDKLPYQYGNLKDRQNMKEVQKHLAMQRREVEAAKCKHLPEWENDDIKKKVCRDEIVKIREGQVVKDTNMWDRPEKRRRVLFPK